MTQARRAAYKVLMRTETEGAYSNIALNAELSKVEDEREKGLATAIVYGTLENTELFDRQIRTLTGKPAKKLQPEVRVILRMGLSQLVFMDKIPESAAVNECVNLAKKFAPKASGLVNGVLRSFIRGGKTLSIPDKNSDPILYLSAKYSAPKWLAQLWVDSYGEEKCEEILSSIKGRAPVYLRVNTTKITEEELMEKLRLEGVKANKSKLENALTVEASGAIDKLSSYEKGFFHVQDLASQLCCMTLGAAENSTVYDVCAAPGGKTFTLAQHMNNTGKIISCDLYPQRVSLIAQGAERLGLTNVRATVRDAMTKEEESADFVLCDAPCSGLGVIRRKPDIMFKAKDEAESLADIQRDILGASASLVKAGGVLVYSTCTLNPAENENNARCFLENNPDFETVPFELPQWVNHKYENGMATIFPDREGADGFFIAKFRRKG